MYTCCQFPVNKWSYTSVVFMNHIYIYIYIKDAYVDTSPKNINKVFYEMRKIISFNLSYCESNYKYNVSPSEFWNCFNHIMNLSPNRCWHALKLWLLVIWMCIVLVFAGCGSNLHGALDACWALQRSLYLLRWDLQPQNMVKIRCS